MITNFKRLFLSVLFCLFAISIFAKSHYWYYDTRNIPKGLSLQALSVNSTFSGISYLFATNNLVDGFTVYKYIQTSNGPNWSIYFYDAIFGGWDIDPLNTNAVIEHGEAVWVLNPGDEIKQVFFGDVVPNSITKIKKGFNLICSKTMKAGGITTIHGLSPNNYDTVYKWNGSNWSTYMFEDSDTPQWLPFEPVIGPFEGFWYNNATTNTFDWVQTDYLPNVYNPITRRQIINYKYYEPTPGWNAGLLCFTTRLNSESMITFSYSETLTLDPNGWYMFYSSGPAVQPNDDNFTALWASRQGWLRGYIRVSTW